MDYIDHETKIYDTLNILVCLKEERGILEPNIAEDTLEMLYSQLAGILLPLLVPSLPCIGSLSQIDDFTWEVGRWSLLINMNELVRLRDLPRLKLPGIYDIFSTALLYIETLADLNIKYLVY